MELKCPLLLNMHLKKNQQNLWSFYPSEPFQNGHFNVRYPVFHFGLWTQTIWRFFFIWKNLPVVAGLWILGVTSQFFQPFPVECWLQKERVTQGSSFFHSNSKKWTKKYRSQWENSRVSVQGVKSLGGHFACLCRGFEFYEVKKNFCYYFSKRKLKYFYTFNHFYSEKSSKRAR